jgi:hypothetical protein
MQYEARGDARNDTTSGQPARRDVIGQVKSDGRGDAYQH